MTRSACWTLYGGSIKPDIRCEETCSALSESGFINNIGTLCTFNISLSPGCETLFIKTPFCQIINPEELKINLATILTLDRKNL